MVVSSLVTSFPVQDLRECKDIQGEQVILRPGKPHALVDPFWSCCSVVDLNKVRPSPHSPITRVHISVSKGRGTMRISPFSPFCNQAFRQVLVLKRTCRSIQAPTAVRSEYWLKIGMRNLWPILSPNSTLKHSFCISTFDWSHNQLKHANSRPS